MRGRGQVCKDCDIRGQVCMQERVCKWVRERVCKLGLGLGLEQVRLQQQVLRQVRFQGQERPMRERCMYVYICIMYLIVIFIIHT